MMFVLGHMGLGFDIPLGQAWLNRNRATYGWEDKTLTAKGKEGYTKPVGVHRNYYHLPGPPPVTPNSPRKVLRTYEEWEEDSVEEESSDEESEDEVVLEKVSISSDPPSDVFHNLLR
jgi:hypothetical protein